MDELMTYPDTHHQRVLKTPWFQHNLFILTSAASALVHAACVFAVCTFQTLS